MSADSADNADSRPRLFWILTQPAAEIATTNTAAGTKNGSSLRSRRLLPRTQWATWELHCSSVGTITRLTQN